MDVPPGDSPDPSPSVSLGLFIKNDQLQRQLESHILGAVSWRLLVLLLITELLGSVAYFDYELRVGNFATYMVFGSWCIGSTLLCALHIALLCRKRGKGTVTPSPLAGPPSDRSSSSLSDYSGAAAAISSNLLATALASRIAYFSTEPSLLVVFIAALFPLHFFLLTGGVLWGVLVCMWSVSFLSIIVIAATLYDKSSYLWYMVAVSAIVGAVMYQIRLMTIECVTNHAKENETHRVVIANKMKSDNLGTIIGTVSHDIKSQLLPLALGSSTSVAM